MSRHGRTLWIVLAMGLAATSATAQQSGPPRRGEPVEPVEGAYPDQPVVPQGPVFQRRAAQPDDYDSREAAPAGSRDRVASQRAGGDRGAYEGAASEGTYRRNELRGDDPRANDPRGNDLRARDPRAGDARAVDPRGADPRGAAPAQPAAMQPPIPPPTPEQERFLDQVLAFWEQCSAKVKDFECTLVRLEYDKLNGSPNKPLFEDNGELKYMAPDRGLFVIGKPREERWLCDGKAVYQYDYRSKQVQEFKLPPDLQGRGIADSPLPFIFGANRAQLKRRYYLEITTPADKAKNQVWIRAFPRFQADARNFRSVEIILLQNEEMLPAAMQVVQPNGDNYTVYLFQKPSINKSGLVRMLADEWWRFKLPGRDWQFLADQSQAPPDRRGPAGAPAASGPPAAGRAASGSRSGQSRR